MLNRILRPGFWHYDGRSNLRDDFRDSAYEPTGPRPGTIGDRGVSDTTRPSRLPRTGLRPRGSSRHYPEDSSQSSLTAFEDPTNPALTAIGSRSARPESAPLVDELPEGGLSQSAGRALRRGVPNASLGQRIRVAIPSADTDPPTVGRWPARGPCRRANGDRKRPDAPLDPGWGRVSS
jgi:hypothetical protein